MQDIWSLTFNVLLVASAFVFSLPLDSQQKQGCVSNSGEICTKYIQFALLWCIIIMFMFMFMISQNAVQRVVDKLLLNNYNYSILYIVDTICMMWCMLCIHQYIQWFLHRAPILAWKSQKHFREAHKKMKLKPHSTANAVALIFG